MEQVRKKKCIDWLPAVLAHTTQPYLYYSTLISLQLIKLTPIPLQLDLWLTWTLSHELYLFEHLTWSYSDSNSTWSTPNSVFQLIQIPHPWTLLDSVLADPNLDSSLLDLKVLIPLWTWTPSQFGLVSTILFLNSSEQLTQVTFTYRLTQSAYPNLARTAYTNSTRAPYLITSMLTWPYTFIPGRITLPILLPTGLLVTQPYMVLPGRTTIPDSSPDRTSTFPIIPGHLTQLPYPPG
jgi:hypothetical protein